MNLVQLILHCNKYENRNEHNYIVFLQEREGKFSLNSEILILDIPKNKLHERLKEISDLSYNRFKYFLEMSIIQEFYNELVNLPQFRGIKSIAERIIFYAENKK